MNIILTFSETRNKCIKYNTKRYRKYLHYNTHDISVRMCLESDCHLLTRQPASGPSLHQKGLLMTVHNQHRKCSIKHYRVRVLSLLISVLNVDDV